MSQLSLNLIAISIFTVTMASLLGPIVHLSPLVPAIATAGALGIATLDTLSWQGQGATLLLDRLAQFSPQYRQRIAHHEAGHFLVAHHLGIPITGYSLNAWEALRQGHRGQGGVQVDAQELEQGLRSGSASSTSVLDRYCTVWMAGVAAESTTYGDVQGGKDDRQVLRAVLHQRGLPPAESEQAERWALLRAKTILTEQADAYRALVTAMEQRLSVADCIQAIALNLVNIERNPPTG
ncbi:ATP-dependent Zn protease [Pantanalinema sp. GBBB05]|uniref:ATP-dependent Zn protease n=1 Tax=Pantanalinema sp. GBBB05 TaxID=2604139 RepID=UPI001D586CAA|nr:ATP-dependent Zn protease [Pantanalinema sp. GBBB05]